MTLSNFLIFLLRCTQSTKKELFMNRTDSSSSSCQAKIFDHSDSDPKAPTHLMMQVFYRSAQTNIQLYIGTFVSFLTLRAQNIDLLVISDLTTLNDSVKCASIYVEKNSQRYK
jgi:hypothetical protein